MNLPDLEQAVQQVNSKESFLEFVSLLGADWERSQEIEKATPSSPYAANALGWENPRLGPFLHALAAWGVGSRISSEPSWRSFAEMLLAAKIYE
ncbi:MAG: hypothetical protein JNN17_16720 [Verrucomicrobiaceae bacterium]|nr:hypothetical protein [Verrucomicrobiaceae bacterium]